MAPQKHHDGGIDVAFIFLEQVSAASAPHFRNHGAGAQFCLVLKGGDGIKRLRLLPQDVPNRG
jgi:hypothetical protein